MQGRHYKNQFFFSFEHQFLIVILHVFFYCLEIKGASTLWGFAVLPPWLSQLPQKQKESGLDSQTNRRMPGERGLLHWPMTSSKRAQCIQTRSRIYPRNTDSTYSKVLQGLKHIVTTRSERWTSRQLLISTVARARRRPNAWNGFVRERLNDINESKLSDLIRFLLQLIMHESFRAAKRRALEAYRIYSRTPGDPLTQLCATFRGS